MGDAVTLMLVDVVDMGALNCLSLLICRPPLSLLQQAQQQTHSKIITLSAIIQHTIIPTRAPMLKLKKKDFSWIEFVDNFIVVRFVQQQ